MGRAVRGSRIWTPVLPTGEWAGAEEGDMCMCGDGAVACESECMCGDGAGPGKADLRMEFLLKPSTLHDRDSDDSKKQDLLKFLASGKERDMLPKLKF
ncbi:hypothetical protein Dsin_031010 [Dipteronia sinensis]|uniref:Uncharacterized protein n=1 Tax=Dipteronia sinensis TaxID=43782 RepID=A0AAE0DRY4_9ROSI|nr:hypothetical protein Dsin_031010 [Dipteronia sinensis]